jgi:hypothetical protein
MNRFVTMSDEDLKLFIEEYELLPVVRIIIPVGEYRMARFECYSRFKDDSIQRIDFFDKNPMATIEEYENYTNN